MLGTLALAACATADHRPDEKLVISRLSFENRSQAFVAAARLLVPATGAFVSCGNIPPGGTCATTFPEVKYTGNEMEVTWSQGGQIYSTGKLRLSPSAEVLEAGTASVQVIIAGPGVAGAQLVPAPASPE